MDESYKVLGQASPSATTAAALYTVPSATEAVISTIFVCNRGTSDGTFRIAVRPDGDSLVNQHYIAFDPELAAKAFTAITVGITVDAGDIIEVYASTGDFSFNAFGTEIS
jgi:hypothetical protein